ncbi:MAG: ABC transporter ATP-binding protein [Xanthomonadaceae bacterium]|nr:ABC transporter ATP-binding protein [Xanthomonadaceae bacterium]
MIELTHVSKRYGQVVAVEDVSMHVGAGRIFGLIGHNGAGKSTLIKMMLGILPASEGDIRIRGREVRGPGFRDLRRGISYLPENVALYDNLTGLETMRFLARLKSADAAQCAELLGRVGLADAMHRNVREYSKGMRQRLGFAQALIGKPELLFLDEPTNGLDPVAIHAFYDALAVLRDDGATILISTHLLAEIQTRVDGLAIIANGRLIAQGTVAGLTAEADLPVELRLQVRESALERVLRELDETGFVTLAAYDETTVVCNVMRMHKIELLSALAGMGDMLAEFEFREPTLEALYLHHQHQGSRP